MNDPFDGYSAHLDDQMDNWVGRYIRARSLELLFEHSAPGSRVLDIGCGTGIEARELSCAGRIVFGFDPSVGMLGRAIRNAPDATLVKGSLDSIVDLSRENGWSEMDMVYSSLGAFNCVPMLKGPLRDASHVLKGGGHLIISFMNRYPILEVALLLSSFRVRKARERISREQVVDIGGSTYKAFYYNVGDLKASLPSDVKLVKVRALPLVLPPLRAVQGKIRMTLQGPLLWSDRTFAGMWPFNRFGDHVQVVMRKDDRSSDE